MVREDGAAAVQQETTGTLVPAELRLPADEVVRRFGGRAGYGEIVRHSTQHDLRSALNEGRLVNLRRGVYGLPGLPAPLSTASRLSGVLSHVTAAEHWQLPTLLPAGAIHVLVPRGASRRAGRAGRGVVLHYSGDTQNPRAEATSPLRTVLDCAAGLPFREALAIADSAARPGRVSPEELRAAASTWPARGRRRVAAVTANVDARAANPFESGLRGILVENGILGFVPQLPVDESGFQAIVDLGDRRRRIVLEADSFEWHGKRKSLRKDCWRYDELVSRGWLVLRFCWEQVMFHPEWVARIVRTTCDLRGPRRNDRSWSPNSAPASRNE